MNSTSKIMSNAHVEVEDENQEDTHIEVEDENEEDTHVKVEDEINGLVIKRYSSEFLNELTSNLSDSCKVGEGGYGKVYKAQLPNSDEQVAIKVLKKKHIVEDRETFMAEVKTMSNTNHKNIIKLIGYCFKPKMKALVYEYMERGSLDIFLYNKKSDVEWEKFYRIAVEIAKGLMYFHECANEPIIHYDIKAENVLLDNSLSPKITDFGLAMLIKRNVKSVNLTRTRGTPCYTAPELFSHGIATTKCDVYSYGMLLFEILGRRKIFVQQGEVYFPKQVWNSFHSGELECLFDDIKIPKENRVKANILAKVALLCIHDNPDNRPSMEDVWFMLIQKVPVQQEPSLPTLSWESSNSSTTSASSNRMSEDDSSGCGYSGSNISWSNQDPESISSSLKDNTPGSTVSIVQEETQVIYQPNTMEEGLEGTRKKFTYENGDVYEGTWKNGLRHGDGKCSWTNGNVYVGEWKDDLQERKGKFIYGNGDYFEGEYKKGVIEGQGKYVYINGDVYIGEYRNGIQEGRGHFCFTNGNEYIGEFKNWKFEGHGKFIYENGTYYEGTYKNHLKDGHGRIVYPNGEEHLGEWKKGIRQYNEEFHYNCIYEKNDDEGANQSSSHNDRGNQWNASCTMEEGLEGRWKKFTYENGDVYEGTWKNDLRHGKGRMLWTNGNMYVGEWKDDFQDGWGKFQWEDGDYYEGTYKKGDREGQGKFAWVNGQVYIGEYRNGNQEGQGKFVYENGEYIGEFKNGIREGQGKYVYLNGDEYIGEYRNGIQEGQGKYVYNNGNEYVGEFKNWKFDGHGKFIYKNGSYHEGTYKNYLKDGKGRFVSAGGKEYHGEWINGIRQDHEEIHYNSICVKNDDEAANQSTHNDRCNQWKASCTMEEGLEGTWKKFTYEDGAVYEGTWKNDLRHGKGRMLWTNGNMYVGEWKDDFQDGRGKYHYENGDYYKGTYKKGVEEGQGKYIFANGNEYVGEFKDDKFEGHGKFIYKNGDEYIGEFKNDIQEGQGKYVYKDGDEYVFFFLITRG